MKRRFSESVGCSAPFPSSLLASLRRFMIDGKFCDVTLKSGDFEIKAHRNVLAAVSERFEKMCSVSTELDFSEISPSTLTKCIEFIYTGNAKVTEENVRELLQASGYMHVEALTQKCLEYMADRIDLNSSTEVLTLSRHYRNNLVNMRIKKYLAKYFEKFIASESFLRIQYEELLYCFQLLQDGGKELEMQKWQAVLNWTEFDPEGRRNYFKNVFGTIDVKQFPKKFVENQMIAEPLVKSSPECMSTIMSAIVDAAVLQSQEEKQVMSHIVSHKHESQVILKFELVSNSWSRVAVFPSTFTENSAMISHLGNIYVGTGYELHEYSQGKWSSKIHRSSVTCTKCRSVFWNVGNKRKLFEFADSLWRTDALPLHKVDLESQIINCPKCHCNFMYNNRLDNENIWCTPPESPCYNRCIGTGHTVYMMTKTCVLEYSVTSKQILCHFITTNLGNGFFITASKDKIFAMGGRGSEQDMFEYNLCTKKCSKLSPMHSGRVKGHAFWYDGSVFALGGDVTRTVEIYDPDLDTWCFIPDPGIPFQPVNLFVGEKLYLISGSFEGRHAAIDLEKLKVWKDKSMAEFVTEKMECGPGGSQVSSMIL